MSQYVASEYLENTHRLALAVHPLDFVLERGLMHPVRVDIERGLPHRTKRRGAAYCRPQRRDLDPDALCRHDSGRFTLLFYNGIPAAIDLRLYDHHRYYVPRRLHVPLRTLAQVLQTETDEALDYLFGRVRRPVLFPGAAYDVGRTITGLRGRVMRGGAPMRWCVVEARLPVSGAVVGRARGDDRGEFVLVIAPNAAPEGDLDVSGRIEIEVSVAGPPAPPVPLPEELPGLDGLWDLPLEEVPEPGDPDDVSTGVTLPPDYVFAPSALRNVEFELGRMLTGRDIEDFEFSLP